ncbi:peptidyl-prolyl cis-trans isomerase [Anaeromyxobacter diazotrophicus]|uniref:Peptidylprolyl isomerase n=1 Tax=Anaeromyxobacter diazotrophicus TaxID=2590199 RepID=A0A7I9VMN3_9BACT|nr:peptidyl-prolyl cis-trans isomerase [Anaeromyxobacter diazotrophicus]GEJ57662.1 peptidylprolyl isomerase [Anaeromyxobacter diazotrophicus]
MFRRASLVLALAAALACSKGPAKKGPVVASGGGVTITADELKARLDEQSPMIRASFQSADRKKQFLDNMIRFELLAKAAEKEGLANDPDVQFTLKKVMVSKYYQRFFQQDPGAAKGVPDAEVQKYYDEHPDEYHRPARVHLAHVFFKAEPGSPERAKKAAEAKKLLAKVLVDEKKNPTALSTAAREASEDEATKQVGGDLALKTEAELTQAYGKAFADAALKLKDNETSPVVVEGAHGLHLVRALGRQPEMNRTFEEVKPQIAARLSSQKKTKDFDEFVKKLREDAHIQVNDQELEKVAVAAAPAGGAMGGMMGGAMMGGPMGGAPHGAMPQRPGAATATPAPAAPAPAR